MHPSQVPLPNRLKDLPKIGPYIVPYVTFYGENGVPDLRIVDETKRTRCLRRQLCGVCGQKLDEVMVFIGGPLSVKNRRFIDPALHEECAIYAAQVCPYLSNSASEYSDATPRHEGRVVTVFEDVHPERPDRLALYYCRGYEIEIVNAARHAKAKKPFKLNWDVMPQKTPLLSKLRRIAMKELPGWEMHGPLTPGKANHYTFQMKKGQETKIIHINEGDFTVTHERH